MESKQPPTGSHLTIPQKSKSSAVGLTPAWSPYSAAGIFPLKALFDVSLMDHTPLETQTLAEVAPHLN